MHSSSRIAVAMAIVALSFSGSLAAHADESAAPDTAMVYAVNSHRISIGLGELSRDTVLDAIATTHAKRMAATDRIFHNRRLRSEITAALPNWRLAGENVGVGVAADQVQQLFLESASHRANIERNSFERLGVGVAPTADGRLYFVQVFALTSPVPVITATEKDASKPRIIEPAEPIRAASGPQALAAVPAKVVPMRGVQFINEESTSQAPKNRRAGMFIAALSLLGFGFGVGLHKLRERARKAARITLPPPAHGKAHRPRAMVRV